MAAIKSIAKDNDVIKKRERKTKKKKQKKKNTPLHPLNKKKIKNKKIKRRERAKTRSRNMKKGKFVITNLGCASGMNTKMHFCFAFRSTFTKFAD